MALAATVYHLRIDLSDVDRNVYEALDLRVARHPSENVRYLLTRVLAYALSFEEGIAFGHGLSTVDEPAVWVHDLTGTLTAWIEVGTPSAERLHKATKASPRVAVFTQHDPELLKKAARARAIHRVAEIAVTAIDPAFLDALDAVTDRNAHYEVVRTEGQLYVTTAGRTFETTLEAHSLQP
jgi:uncharacterized protein YaeQ